MQHQQHEQQEISHNDDERHRTRSTGDKVLLDRQAFIQPTTNDGQNAHIREIGDVNPLTPNVVTWAVGHSYKASCARPG